jgi:kynurenine formamidase
MTQYRAVFDAQITFRNEGGLQVQGFRLDLPSSTITDDDLGQLLIRHLGLLLVDDVRVHGVRIIEEPHKGSRGTAAAPTRQRLIDLTHPITAGMVTYPGLPGPQITPHLTRESSRRTYAPGTEFAIDRISMLGNTGTYLDSPFHRYADGTDLADLPLAKTADLPTLVLRHTTGRAVDATLLAGLAADPRGYAVLLHTGGDANWGTPAYADDAAYLAEDGAQYLADAGAALVGIDSVNIDQIDAGGTRPAHSILLAAGIPVVEHLTGLAEVPLTGARLHAAPPPVRDFGTFPVRAYVVVP